jgi:hypothetical protein
MASIMRGCEALTGQLQGYLKSMEADEEGGVTLDPSGKWREAALGLTKDILGKANLYGRTMADQKEDALGPLLRMVEKVAGLNEAIAKMKDAPEEEGLRGLGWRLGEAKRELMSLGRVLMMSQDPSLAAEAHELTGRRRTPSGQVSER